MAEDQITKTKNEKSAIGKILSIIVDVLIIPIIILAFICTIFTFSAKANNKVPQIFGKSIVTVLSDSMEPEYKVGDVLIISGVKNLDTLKIGDNIAFYAPIWLGYPFTTTLDSGEKVSNVIYHQIVDIIYPKDERGNPVRHFVCRGTNLSAPGYTYVGEGNGNYKKEVDGEVEKFVISQGTGDYDIVLENLTPNGDVTTDDIEASNMSTMQYITDEYVVGMYDSSLSPAIGGFIKFSSTSLGLICMVIVPASIMLVFVILGLVKEISENKKVEGKEQLVLESNMIKLKETSEMIKREKLATRKEPDIKQKQEKEEVVDIASVISGVIGKKESGIAKPPIKTEKSILENKAGAKIIKPTTGQKVPVVPNKKLPPKKDK